MTNPHDPDSEKERNLPMSDLLKRAAASWRVSLLAGIAGGTLLFLSSNPL